MAIHRPGVFTYTIFDGNPNASGSCSWPSHTDVEIEADSADEVLEEALDEAGKVGEAGDRFWVIVWNADNVVAARGNVTIEGDPGSSCPN